MRSWAAVRSPSATSSSAVPSFANSFSIGASAPAVSSTQSGPSPPPARSASVPLMSSGTSCTARAPGAATSARWCTWSSTVTVPSAPTTNEPGPTGSASRPPSSPASAGPSPHTAENGRAAAARVRPNACAPSSTGMGAVAAYARCGAAGAAGGQGDLRPGHAVPQNRVVGEAVARAGDVGRHAGGPPALGRVPVERQRERAERAGIAGADVHRPGRVALVAGRSRRRRAVHVVAQRDRLTGQREHRRHVGGVDDAGRIERRWARQVADRTRGRPEQQHGGGSEAHDRAGSAGGGEAQPASGRRRRAWCLHLSLLSWAAWRAPCGACVVRNVNRRDDGPPVALAAMSAQDRKRPLQLRGCSPTSTRPRAHAPSARP